MSKTESRSAGAARIQSKRRRTNANPLVLETLQTYRAAENPVNDRVPQDFQMISTSGIAWDRRAARETKIPRLARDDILRMGRHRLQCDELARGARIRATVWPSVLLITRIRRTISRLFSGNADGRLKIEKRSYFGGPCFEGTLRSNVADLGFPIFWSDLRKFCSESSPVAGTIRERSRPL